MSSFITQSCSPLRMIHHACDISGGCTYTEYNVLDRGAWLTAYVHPFIYIRAIGVSHTACKDEFRQNIRSHSWSVFYFI